MNNAMNWVARIVLIAFFSCLTACSNSSDTSPMQNEMKMEIETTNSADIIDPRLILSSLQFDTTEYQASYQCLLSAAHNTAISEGMQAFPVLWVDDPTVGRGSFQTWCNTSGESALVNEDLDRCSQGSVSTIKAPGTNALSVATKHFSKNVSTINYTSKSIPEAGKTGWAVSFSKTFAESNAKQDKLAINFQRFDGSQLLEESGTLQHPYVYRDKAIGMVEFVRTDIAVNAYLADYTGSVAQFKSTANAYLSAVMELIEAAIRGKDALTEEEINSAIQRAKVEIDQSKAFFDLNGDDVHQVLLARETYLDCE